MNGPEHELLERWARATDPSATPITVDEVLARSSVPGGGLRRVRVVLVAAALLLVGATVIAAATAARRDPTVTTDRGGSTSPSASTSTALDHATTGSARVLPTQDIPITPGNPTDDELRAANQEFVECMEGAGLRISNMELTIGPDGGLSRGYQTSLAGSGLTFDQADAISAACERHYLSLAFARGDAIDEAQGRPTTGRLRLRSDDWEASRSADEPSTAAGAAYVVRSADGVELERGTIGRFGEAVITQRAGKVVVAVPACRAEVEARITVGRTHIAPFACDR